MVKSPISPCLVFAEIAVFKGTCLFSFIFSFSFLGRWKGCAAGVLGGIKRSQILKVDAFYKFPVLLVYALLSWLQVADLCLFLHPSRAVDCAYLALESMYTGEFCLSPCAIFFCFLMVFFFSSWKGNDTFENNSVKWHGLILLCFWKWYPLSITRQLKITGLTSALIIKILKDRR